METPPATFDPKGSTGVSVKTIEQGAATSVLLAASPLVDGVTGRYFEDCQEAVPFETGVRRGVTEYALDPRRPSGSGRSRSTRLRAPDEFSTGRHKRFHHQRKNRHGNVVQPIQLNTNSVLEDD